MPPPHSLSRPAAASPLADGRGGRQLATPGNAARVGLIGAVLLALYSVPLFSTVLPPLVDYPNHLARFWLLATGGDAFYRVRWAALPNLAGDLIVPLLAQAVPVALAGKLFLVLTFTVLLGSTVSLHRVVHHGWRLWPLLAAGFLYNRQFLWGFVNYLFGVGLALGSLALWLALEQDRPWRRILASCVAALLCFFSHIAAFGLYAVMLAGVELMTLLARLRDRDWGAAVRQIALAAPQFVVPAAIVVFSWEPAAAGAVSYAGFWRKFDLLFSVFDNYDRPFDIACYALLLVLLGWLVWSRRLRFAPRLLPAVILVFATYLALPSQILSGSGADHRIPLALFLLIVAGAAPRWPSRRTAALLAGAAGVVLAARLAVVEAVWVRADGTYRADVAGLDTLPSRAKLAVAYPSSAIYPDWTPQIHVPTLAVPRRAAFVPTVFAIPAQQPLALNPPYDELARRTPPPWAWWAAFIGGDRAAQRDAAGVLPEYDAIVFTNRHPFTVPPHPCLQPLAIGPSFQIFLLRKDQTCWGR